MLKSKLAVPVLAFALVMAMGLVACGDNGSTSSSAAADSSAATESSAVESSATEEVSLDDIMYYEGTFENGDGIIYAVGDDGKISLAILPADEAAEGMIVEGEPTFESDGTVTLTGEDGASVSYTINDDGSIEIADYGKADLNPVTKEQIDAELEAITAE